MDDNEEVDESTGEIVAKKRRLIPHRNNKGAIRKMVKRLFAPVGRKARRAR